SLPSNAAATPWNTRANGGCPKNRSPSAYALNPSTIASTQPVRTTVASSPRRVDGSSSDAVDIVATFSCVRCCRHETAAARCAQAQCCQGTVTKLFRRACVAQAPSSGETAECLRCCLDGVVRLCLAVLCGNEP